MDAKAYLNEIDILKTQLNCGSLTTSEYDSRVESAQEKVSPMDLTIANDILMESWYRVQTGGNYA